MKPLAPAPSLVDQVHDALLAEISAGRLAAGQHIVQEQIAARLGVSRQPVQQALLLLRKQGLLREAPGRGLEVAPIDPDAVMQVYELRAAIEGLAARKAALAAQADGGEAARRAGAACIEAGRRAVAAGSLPRMIAADQRFHELLYQLSGNPLLAPAMAAHWTATQRAMGEVLTRDEQPRDIWDQHQRILDAIVAGEPGRAEAEARGHLEQAATFMGERLRNR